VQEEARIERLPQLIAALPGHDRALVERLFAVVRAEGELVPPDAMVPWLERTFGSVEAARRQRITRVINRWTDEGATFNALRARRPNATGPNVAESGHTSGTADDSHAALNAAASIPLALRERIERTVGDDFCAPEEHTPTEVIGRVRGRHVVTAANVAKMDGWHALFIFDRHDPLALDAELVVDLLEVAEAWVARVRAHDPDTRHLFLFWNCLARAGASQVHGHAQAILSHVMPQAGVLRWREAARRYAAETNRDYFDDLVAAHRALGLAGENGEAVWLASLTPAREREVDILLPLERSGELPIRQLAAPLAALLAGMRQRMGVVAFNLAVFGPPAGDTEAWPGFPLVARFVDRGDPLATTADVAAMELFGSSVIASDPFDVARAFQREQP
jgi:hypothetical protein